MEISLARSPIQFQYGISLNEFLSLYGTEPQTLRVCWQNYEWRHPEELVERITHR